jgi:hypothetical protein
MVPAADCIQAEARLWWFTRRCCSNQTYLRTLLQSLTALHHLQERETWRLTSCNRTCSLQDDPPLRAPFGSRMLMRGAINNSD